MANNLIPITSVALVFAGAYGLFFWPSVDFFGSHPYKGDTDKKIIALTFDDGPNPPYTEKLLAILRRYQVPATFFVVGRNLERHPELGRKLTEQGHVIGNHTYRHSFLSYLSDYVFNQEIEKTQNVIRQATGLRPALFRFPWLFRNPKLLKRVRSHSLVPISGRFSSVLETWQPNPTKFAGWALRKISPGAIIIFHDGHNSTGAKRDNTLKAVELFIQTLLEQKYTFVTVDVLLHIEAYQKK